MPQGVRRNPLPYTCQVDTLIYDVTYPSCSYTASVLIQENRAVLFLSFIKIAFYRIQGYITYGNYSFFLAFPKDFCRPRRRQGIKSITGPQLELTQ